jgi:hypothetical protein
MDARTPEVPRLYAGMNESIGEICAGHGEEQLEVISDFLRRAARAGEQAGEQLSRPQQPII